MRRIKKMNLIQHIERMKTFSLKTFWPGARPNGFCEHIRYESDEIMCKPEELTEWCDVIVIDILYLHPPPLRQTMDRQQDISELLSTVSASISTLEDSYEQARSEDENKSISRPLVKSSLEHLRSILEYSAQDIWHSYNTEPRRLYFPYGKKASNFKSSSQNNLPKLKIEKPTIYCLIESLQPYKSNDDWLIDLCTQTNFNKHNQLSRQERVNSSNSTTDVGNLTQINNNTGSSTFTGCTFSGETLGVMGKATISNEMSVEEIKKNIGIPMEVKREFEWVEFHFENSTKDTLLLLKTSHEKISEFIRKLYTEL